MNMNDNKQYEYDQTITIAYKLQ